MGRYKPYFAELLLVVATMLIGLLGFWTIYVGPAAEPQPHHHFHVFTTYLWMGLLLAQLYVLANGKRALHRRIGLAVIVAGPLLVGSAALLAVHSAHRAIETGRPDRLLVENLVGTALLALLLVLAFVFKQRRRVHGAFLIASLVIFLGPAIFFALIAFAPPFRIEGPETFYRFGTATMATQAIILGLVFVMFFKDRRNNWPFLVAGLSLFLPIGIRAIITPLGLIDPLTRLVAAPDKIVTFAVTSVIVSALLGLTALPKRRPPLRPAPVTAG